MIIIFVVVVAFPWLKQEVTSDHLEDSAGQGPDVSTGVIVGANDDLRRAVLSGLDLRSEVVIGPAPVSHVAYLYHHVLINLRPALALLRLSGSSLILLLLIVIQKKVPNKFLSVAID